MYSTQDLHFDNSFVNYLPEETFFQRITPTPLESNHLVSFNPSAATLIDLSSDEQHCSEFISAFSGTSPLARMDPIAMVYSGHQFGSYNPQLGDGRGLLLGEVLNKKQERWDIHLKGAGLTPFSRDGDGRAVLRSTIREYLCSEALHHLGIPSTRGLCIFGSNEPVYREKIESGASLIRLAQSHIRFGTFEYFYYTQQHDALKTLADYTIQRHFHDALEQPNPYIYFFQQVIQKTAELIAKWQAAGFAHGVMNTDNMSIIGETFDFGPFGFLDNFDAAYICNHSDYQGRYAFNQQPSIAYWNCSCLGQALLPLAPAEDIKTVLNQFPEYFFQCYDNLIRKKLGLFEEKNTDKILITELFQLLQDQQPDYTLFFRYLSDYKPNKKHKKLSGLFNDTAQFDAWIAHYTTRLLTEKVNEQQRINIMKSVNPKYILRNYLAQIAIEKAEQKDFSEIDKLLKILSTPYDEQPENEEYAKQAPAWSKTIQVSCSS
ncbi:protein adenylyltransferase SelO [Zooshikella harenae]|uniref:Protein nucleotidyltransferase YdiU n=1 Tax=Zooshikella harenae TaxID=2827238 RepID=A0ABS5ZD39_9GAMM|nr:YdiU family protein [Zooshikella harenae]MBU2711986.1 YdiU family protein [Zooshikella harenae]